MCKKIIASLFIGILCGGLISIFVIPQFISHEEKEHSLFVYGTLRNEMIRYFACLCLVAETPTRLTGYKKDGLNIIPSEQHYVIGSLITVSSEELKRIDEYENTPERYTRETIMINEEKHWVYLKTNDNY